MTHHKGLCYCWSRCSDQWCYAAEITSKQRPEYVITKCKWRFKFPSGHLFYSASSFYPKNLNALCLSFSVCKSLTCLFATLGLKPLCGLKSQCLIQFLFQRLLLLVQIWKNELWIHSEEYGYSQPAQGWGNGTAVVYCHAWKLGRVWKFVLCLWEVCVQLLLP